jgi:thioredoxin reductase (NADPH)
MENMRAQTAKFDVDLITDDIVSMDLEGPIKHVTDGTGATHSARSVILAMGSAYRKLGIEREDELSGHGVSWCATCDGFFFRDQDIVVVGGGDSAVEEATFLTRFANTVTLVHRRDSLRASKIMSERAHSNPKIRFAWNSQVVGLGGDKKLDSVTLQDTATGDVRDISATGLFIAIGHDPRSELVRGVIDTDDEGYVLTKPGSTATNISGVFACGDLVDHTYRQAITAAGSGCSAALDAERFLAHS